MSDIKNTPHYFKKINIFYYIEKKIKFNSCIEAKYFNLFTSRDLKFEDLDEELSLEGVEDDLNSDEEVIKEGKKKTIKELEIGMKIFNKKKFNIINNYKNKLF